MTEVTTASADEGKTAAIIGWLLYLISVPSAFVLLPAGLILAYVARGGSAPWVRAHFDRQVRVGWWALFWGALAWTVFWVGVALSVVLVGIPLLGVAWLIGAIAAIWLVVVSVLGFFRLLNGRAA